MVYPVDGRGRAGEVYCVYKGNMVSYVARNPGKADVLWLDLFSPNQASCIRLINVYRPSCSSKADEEAL